MGYILVGSCGCNVLRVALDTVKEDMRCYMCKRDNNFDHIKSWDFD